MLLAHWCRYCLEFKQPATTSRDTLIKKPTWFLIIKNTQTSTIGIGECSPLAGLSVDDLPSFEKKLNEVCQNISRYQADYLQTLVDYPAIQFGLEMACLDLKAKNNHLFPSEFTQGKQAIAINGLIWMGNKKCMQQQIDEKLKQGFNCLKLKIGALDFSEEYALLKAIRGRYSASDIEIRVDANGAFSADTALDKLQQLAELELHSIEQPIAVKQSQAMAELVEKSPLAIALDEELIGVTDEKARIELLERIKPRYLILKPSLLGGFFHTQQWIQLAEQRNIDWWLTSALESNIGLSALAQWVATLNNPLPQGLGTGLLYKNNVASPLFIHQARLHFDPEKNVSNEWQAKLIT